MEISLLHTYSETFLAVGGLAALMFVQLLTADIVGLRAGHIPGSDVAADHSKLHFRTVRTVANTNESVAIFVLMVIFGVAMAGDPVHLAYAAWGYLASRIAYAFCYYANLQIPRSVCFALSLIALIVLFVVGVRGAL